MINYAFHPQIFSCPEIWALPATEFKLYAALLTFCRPDGTGCFPKNETLAEMVGVKQRSIQIGLASLEKLGVISRRIDHERNGVSGTWRSVLVHYVLGGRTTAVLDRDNGAQSDTDGAQSDDMKGAHYVARRGVSPDAPQRNTPISEHSHKNTRGGAHDSVTDSQSATTRTTLPVAPSLCISPKLTGMINAAFPSNPNAVLSKIAIAGWDERRVEAALMKTDPAKGVNYFASICRNMTDAEIDKTLNPPETAKPGTKSTPGRLVSGDGKRVSLDGGKTWLDAATPMPNMPHPAQSPPPQLNWSTGNHQRRTGTPLGGLLGERVVEMTVAEKQSSLGASTVDSGTVAERRAKLESERAAKAELSQRRQKRAMDLIASGKTRIEATAICRAEGLMD